MIINVTFTIIVCYHKYNQLLYLILVYFFIYQFINAIILTLNEDWIYIYWKLINLLHFIIFIFRMLVKKKNLKFDSTGAK